MAALESEHGGYHDVAWSPKGRLIAAGHYEPLVTLFDSESVQVVATLDPNVFSDEGRTAVMFSPDGTSLASTGFNSIFRWSLPQPFIAGSQGVKRKKLGVKNYAFFIDVAFSADGNTLAGLAEIEGQTSLHFWESGSSQKRGQIILPQFSQRMAWSADNSFIAVIESDEPGVSLWNPATFERSDTVLEGVTASMTAISMHPWRTAIVAGSEAGQIFVWEASGQV